MDDQKDKILIEEPEVEQEEKFSIEGLSQDEIDMAKNNGLYEEPKEGEEVEDEHEEQPEATTEEDIGEQEKEEEVNTDPDNFEDMDKVFDKNEKDFHSKFTPNQKALYFKNKIEKKKRQEAIKERDELKQKVDELRNSSLSAKKIDKIAKLLKEDTENLTIEALNAIIDNKEEIVDEEPAVNADVLRNKIQDRVVFAEKIGKSQYQNFDDMVKLAGEMFKVKPRYQKQFDSMLTDENIDESEIVDFVVDIAKLNENYGKKEIDVKSKDVADRVVKNSKKKVSSAAVSGAGGRRYVSEDELTCEQAKNLPIEKWSKLKESTRKRIRMGIDP